MNNNKEGGWGGSGIEKVLFDFIRQILPDNSTILELGSGDGSTFHFLKYYKVYSIESDKNWINRHPSNYIYAPIINGWFDINAIKNGLPPDYDLIFVDGPLGKSETSLGRSPFLKHLDLFNTEIPIIFHDTYRRDERELAINVAHKLNKPVVFFQRGNPMDYWAIVGNYKKIN